jgi:hypothetical protein
MDDVLVDYCEDASGLIWDCDLKSTFDRYLWRLYAGEICEA